MLKRDFTKSNREYFKQNKKILISIAVFLFIGILVFAIFGLNGNFEVSGYNEFSVTVTEQKAKDLSKYQHQISNIVNSYDGKFDNIRIYGEGDDAKFVVRYLYDVSGEDQLEINKLIAEELDVDVANVSKHVSVDSIASKKDYVYAIATILLIVVIATIFAYARYNGASALAILISNLLGTMAFVSICAIFRLSVGMSYLAMLPILNILISYFAINLFENMHKSNWLISGDYGKAIETGINSSRASMNAVTFGLMLIGVAVVLFAPSAIKYITLNIMFMAVVLLAVGLYVIPFVWSVFITKCRKRDYKIKVNSTEVKKSK